MKILRLLVRVMRWRLLVTAMLVVPDMAIAAAVTDLKFPSSMQLQTVADAMTINGIPTTIYAFRSPDTPAQLAAYFSGLWQGQMARSRAGPWNVLSRRERDTLITVQSQTVAGGGSMGYVAFAPLFKYLNKRPLRPGKDWPMLPGSEPLQDIEARDLGRRSHTLLIRNRHSADENLEFYRAELARQGYEPLSHGALAKGKGGGALILNRGDEQLSLAVAEHGGQTLITVVRVDP